MRTAVVVAAVSVLAGLALADALRNGGSSTPAAPTASPTMSSSTTVMQATRPSPEEEIERIGNSWAPLFAGGNRDLCRYTTQPLCERIACMRVGGVKIRGCKPFPVPFRNSFRTATVQEVAVRGHRAGARFSNGAVVELFGDGGSWRIHKLGGNAARSFF